MADEKADETYPEIYPIRSFIRCHLKNLMSHLYLKQIKVKFIAAVFGVIYSHFAMAAPEEIQVYMDEFAEKGKVGLDLHTIYTFSAFNNQSQTPRHQLRLTPELSYGLNDHFEIAGYFLTNKAAAGNAQTDGIKLRMRYRPIVPSDDSSWYTAVNVELGKLSRRFNSDGSNGEIKGILTWKNAAWVAGLNLNIDRPLKRVSTAPTTYELDGKLAYKLDSDLQFGVEHYAFLGAVRGSIPGFLPNRITFLVSDFKIGKWDINFGVGRASGAVLDKVIIKTIIGVPI